MAQCSTSTKNKYGRKRFSTHLDMTPMVDLAFLLLTFFVLTMTLNEAFVIRVEMPDQDDTADPPEVKAERVLTLILGEKDKIYWYAGGDDAAVNVTHYASTGIRKILREKNASIAKLVVLIKPSSQSRYKNLIDILDEVKLTGIDYYYIVKETPEDQQRIAAARL